VIGNLEQEGANGSPHGEPAPKRQQALGHRRMDIRYPQQVTATPERLWPRGYSASHQIRNKGTCMFSPPWCTLTKPETGAMELKISQNKHRFGCPSFERSF
jgi:hypothetical protein